MTDFFIFCTLQLMTRSAARELFSNTRLQRWCFDVELIFLAQQLRIPVVEVPVDWTEIPGEAQDACHEHPRALTTPVIRAPRVSIARSHQ